MSSSTGARALRDGRISVPAADPHTPPDVSALQPISAVEALAVAPADTLYTLPERSGKLDRPFPIWRHRGRTWDQPFRLRRDGGFLAVGLDSGPDGLGYHPVRASHRPTGFASRRPRTSLYSPRTVQPPP